jgi:hypothetical protein
MPQILSFDGLFWIVFAAVAGYMLFGVLRRGGFKAGLFNARISGTLGEVAASGPRLVRQTVKVHSLDRDGNQLVGVELVSKTFASYQMVPVVLSPEAAKELSGLLQQAARKASGVAT